MSYVQQQRSYTPDPYTRGRTAPTLQPQQQQQQYQQYQQQQHQQYQQYYDAAPVATSTPPPMQPRTPPVGTSTPPPMQPRTPPVATSTPPPMQQRTPPPPEYNTPYPQAPYHHNHGSAEDYASSFGTSRTPEGFKDGNGGGARRRGGGSDYDDESEQPIMSNTDEHGFEYRHPEYGRVIPQAEILNRIVPFWEMIATTAGLLAYHLISKAEEAIAQPNPRSIFLFGSCKSENRQADVDLCAASAVFWGLTAGVAIYFTIATLFAIAVAIETKRKGYPPMFTALWNSPWFFFCYLFRETSRIDLLSIPNRLVGFAFFTRTHIHRLVLATWALIATLLITYSLTKRNVDSNDMDANKKYAASEFTKIYQFYNPYLIPYYVAIYLLAKAICVAVVDIFVLSTNDKPKLVAVNYEALKRE